MKKIEVEGKFVPSTTDIKRAEGHARAIASKAEYDGTVEVWFNQANGEFRFIECVGTGYTVTDDPENEKLIYTAECRR